MPFIDSIYNYAERSEYIDTEHVLPLLIGLSTAMAFYLEIEFLLSLFLQLEYSPLPLVLEPAFKGLVGGLLTTLAYTTEKTSFKVKKSMQTKEKAMGIVLTVMLLVGFGVDWVAQDIITLLRYPTLQLIGLVFLFSLGFIHLLVGNWKLENEWPHVLAGILVVMAPYL